MYKLFGEREALEFCVGITVSQIAQDDQIYASLVLRYFGHRIIVLRRQQEEIFADELEVHDAAKESRCNTMTAANQQAIRSLRHFCGSCK